LPGTGTRGNSLLGLAMQRVLAAARAELVELHTTRVIAPVLLGCVVALFALSARQVDDRADIFFRSHTDLQAPDPHLENRDATPHSMQ